MTYDVAGTPQYMSPEIIAERGHDTRSDWWSLGIVLYELVSGDPPFNSPDLAKLADMICYEDIDLPRGISKDLADLILRLTHKLPDRRLGAHGVEEVKAHPFFKSVNWADVAAKKMKPPVVPKQRS